MRRNRFRQIVDIVPLSSQVAVPRVDPEERILVQNLPYPGMYRAVARYGYLDHVDHGRDFVLKLTERVRAPAPRARARAFSL